MPRGDGTGPRGLGAKTGRGMGQCGGRGISPGNETPQSEPKQGESTPASRGPGRRRGQGNTRQR
ncbi:MAG: DUF5320 domain-containing protein [Syntrophaceae bacterium]|nr:DUF5320 domain-containing protein [Deltaproteobacteria bacterium]